MLYKSFTSLKDSFILFTITVRERLPEPWLSLLHYQWSSYIVQLRRHFCGRFNSCLELLRFIPYRRVQLQNRIIWFLRIIFHPFAPVPLDPLNALISVDLLYLPNIKTKRKKPVVHHFFHHPKRCDWWQRDIEGTTSWKFLILLPTSFFVCMTLFAIFCLQNLRGDSPGLSYSLEKVGTQLE